MVTLNNDRFLQENAVQLKATKAKGLEGGESVIWSKNSIY